MVSRIWSCWSVRPFPSRDSLDRRSKPLGPSLSLPGETSLFITLHTHLVVPRDATDSSYSIVQLTYITSHDGLSLTLSLPSVLVRHDTHASTACQARHQNRFVVCCLLLFINCIAEIHLPLALLIPYFFKFIYLSGHYLC